LTIVDEQGKPLDMGTEFDSFKETAHTAYFEKQNGKQAEAIRENRRLLYHVMTAAGFTNLPTEWWHYDYGDRFWAYYKGQDAIYDGIPE
jgi:D-alanyl-D-alanine dipeptidase